VEEIKSCFN